MIAMSMIKSLTAEIGIKHKICLSLEIEKCPKIGPRSDQTKHQFYNILFIFSGIQEQKKVITIIKLMSSLNILIRYTSAIDFA